ncbi:LPXTG cell wall anchor domain-containing protein [Bacillus cereus]
MPQTGNAGDFGMTMYILIGSIVAMLVGVVLFTRRRKAE